MPWAGMAAGLFLAVVFLASGWFGRGWYDEKNKLADENAAYVEWVKEFKRLDDAYQKQLTQLPVSDSDTGPSVSAALDGLRTRFSESSGGKGVLRPAKPAKAKE